MEFVEFNKFKDIEYKRPNFKEIGFYLNERVNKLKKASTKEEVFTLLEECTNKALELMTMCTIAEIRNTIDKSDKFYEDEMTYINKETASLGIVQKKLNTVILKCKFKEDLIKEYGELYYKNIEVQNKNLKLTIIPLLIKESQLGQKYSKDAAMCKTTFRGEECNFYGLLKHMVSTDRTERQEAFIAWANLYESVSDKLDETYDKLCNVRRKIAKRLGYNNYIDYIYTVRQRYDYNKDDVANFRKAVKEYIVPICEDLYNKQKSELGIDELHWYDEELTFKEGNANPIGTKDELVEKARKMYMDMSKETGEFFNFMTEHDLFDLETKPNKHMGGYCTALPLYGAPFIFSNFNGTSQDVDVLTHEAGHAFQAYIASRNLKHIDQSQATIEICEVHSMAMEQFAYPYLDDFFKDADKYRYHHLTNAIKVIPYLVCVDEFQYKVFENPKMNHMERRACWREIEKNYMPWRDYDGNEFLSNGGFWMQKQHIFLYPFYYIDYALAQTCAFQYFFKNQVNHEEAWNDYLKLCKAGGTVGYFDLLKVGNLKSPFDPNTLKEIAEEYKEVVKKFEEKLK